MIKPNFADIPVNISRRPRRGALFVGRLAPEKGAEILSEVLKTNTSFKIRVIGEGPEGWRLEQCPGAEMFGWCSSDEVYKAMRSASYLIAPSICYENFPRAIVESFACGLPVIASRLGAMAEIVEDRKTGLLFEPGSARDLAEKIGWAERNVEEMKRMGRNARKVYEAKYTPGKNYEQLMEIYDRAIGLSKFQYAVL